MWDGAALPGELPVGDHHLRMSITDLAGKTTTTNMVLTVSK